MICINLNLYIYIYRMNEVKFVVVGAREGGVWWERDKKKKKGEKELIVKILQPDPY